MIRPLLFLWLCLWALSAQAQQPELVTLQGRVLDGADSMGAPYVHIYGLQSKTGGSSNADGTFSILVLPGDTLRFTSVGYITKQIFLPKDLSTFTQTTILIFREMYNIDEVIVMPAPDMRRAPQTTPPPPPANTNTPIFGIGTGPGGGITFGFDSKAAHIRNQQEYISQWEYEEAMNEYIAYRYNADFIQQFVTLADDQVGVFINYCNLPAAFIVQSSDYDLAKAIKDCYKSFVGQ